LGRVIQVYEYRDDKGVITKAEIENTETGKRDDVTLDTYQDVLDGSHENKVYMDYRTMKIRLPQ